jgi:transposase
MAWLQALPEADALNAMRRDMGIERVTSLNRALKLIETALAKQASGHPGVALLMTIPGVGIRTAEAVVAYIDAPGRFGRNKAIGSYFGLIPSQDSSAGKNRLGHITRQGPATVRRLLSEAAWQGVRRSPEIRAYFERIHQQHPERRKIALAASAHYLLRVMLAMLNTGELWRHTAA